MADLLLPWAGTPGPLRVLTLHLKGTTLSTGCSPAVLVDGRQYVVPWGTVQLEVPADRAVHLAVVVLHRRPLGAAWWVLAPEHPAALEYAAPSHLSRPGELGPPGSTQHRGRGLQVGLLASLLLVLVLFVALVAFLLTQVA